MSWVSERVYRRRARVRQRRGGLRVKCRVLHVCGRKEHACGRKSVEKIVNFFFRFCKLFVTHVTRNACNVSVTLRPAKRPPKTLIPTWVWWCYPREAGNIHRQIMWFYVPVHVRGRTTSSNTQLIKFVGWHG